MANWVKTFLHLFYYYNFVFELNDWHSALITIKRQRELYGHASANTHQLVVSALSGQHQATKGLKRLTSSCMEYQDCLGN